MPLRRICPKCGAEIESIATQAFDNNGLVWSVGYSCPDCGDQLEEDGRDAPPEAVRTAILQQEGEWGLFLNAPEPHIAAGLILLRRSLRLSLPEAVKLKERLPGPVVTGTRVEMNRLAALLNAGIDRRRNETAGHRASVPEA